MRNRPVPVLHLRGYRPASPRALQQLVSRQLARAAAGQARVSEVSAEAARIVRAEMRRGGAS